jgi:hypothetical protein
MDLPQLDAESAKLTTLRALAHREQGVAVLVLGMHRAGTSALAGMLHLVGLPIGSHPMLSDEANRKGYFENHRIVAFNDRLLAQFGSRWDDPLPLRHERFLSATARSAAEDLAELLRTEFREHPAVIVKDPRLCRLVPIWREALGQANRRLAVVVSLRHPLEVAASLEARDSLSRGHALSLWLQHVLAAERESRGLPRCFIAYDGLLRDWRSAIRTIGEALEVDWPRDPASVADEIDAFLSSELRHHSSDQNDLAICDRIHFLCSRAWIALNRSPFGAAEENVLDEVAREFDGALEMLSPLIGELVQVRGRAADQEEELEAEITRRGHLEDVAEAELARHQDLEARFRLEAERHRLTRQDAQKQLEASERRRESELGSLRGQLDAVLSSTAWRATWPLRSAAKRLPPPARRALRAGAKFLWWMLTLRVKGKWRERGRNIAAPQASTPPSSAAEEEPGKADVTNDTEAAAAAPIALPYRGFLEAMAVPTIAKAIERLKRFPLFSAEDYARMNGDVDAGPMDPCAHFLCFGAYEDRRWFREDRIARDIGRYVSGGKGVANPTERELAGPKDETEIARLALQSPPVGIYVGSLDNIFMKEIAEDLAADLRRIGVTVSLRDEMSSIEDRPPIAIFVAVDEFFLSSRGREWIREDVVANAFMFQVEQIQTHWFTNGLPLLLLSRGVIDLGYQTADLLGRTGLPALHFTPGPREDPSALLLEDTFHPLFQVLPAAAKAEPERRSPFAKRPLDIVFFGVTSPHRDKFFARHAAFLSDYETFIHCPLPGRGPIAGGRGALTRLAAHACGHAKISLNLHEEEFPYFEWHRIVRLGMSSGSVVVSEPCLPHPDFKPGVHYFEENARHILDLLEWLLRTEEGRREAERVRENVNALIFDESRKRQNAARLLEFLIEHRPE